MSLCRILANRQSAQRSRVRKLQYISELERSVNALQVLNYDVGSLLYSLVPCFFVEKKVPPHYFHEFLGGSFFIIFFILFF